MGIRSWWRGESLSDATFSVTPPVNGAPVEPPADIVRNWTGIPVTVGRVSRAEALSVPAVLRARNLICGTLGSLPLHLHNAAREQVPWPLFDQPEPDVPRSVTMTATFEDLMFEGVAWWRVTRFGWHGFPVEVRRLRPEQVSVNDSKVWVDGRVVPDAELIRFDSPNPPLLVTAARAIKTCIALDQAAARFANEPLPLGYFAPAEGVGIDPDPVAVQDILDQWEAARRTRATGYVSSALQFQALSWSPEQLQLGEARQTAVLEIARATGVDPEDLGVSTTSRTYQNSEQRRLDLIDFTMGAFVSAVQDRCSMPDVSMRGHYARLVFGGFLRSDALTRYAAYKAGLEVGALRPEEIRDLEDRPAHPETADADAPGDQVPATPALEDQ